MSKRFSVDWAKVDATTDEDIARDIAEDPDLAPELDDRFWRRAELRIPDDLDVRAVRAKTSLSQSRFAKLYGFSVRTLQKWETGERRPNRSARVLLHLIDCNPAFVAMLARKVGETTEPARD
jgi:putative transcriptional regulator